MINPFRLLVTGERNAFNWKELAHLSQFDTMILGKCLILLKSDPKKVSFPSEGYTHTLELHLPLLALAFRALAVRSQTCG